MGWTTWRIVRNSEVISVHVGGFPPAIVDLPYWANHTLHTSRVGVLEKYFGFKCSPSSRPPNAHTYKKAQGSAPQRYATAIKKGCFPLLKKIAQQTVMCAPQLTEMLACWAASGDIHSVGKCQESAEMLFDCMRRTVRRILPSSSLYLMNS